MTLPIWPFTLLILHALATVVNLKLFLFQFSRQDELPMLETVEELAQWNVTPVETFTFPTSPVSSPSKPTDLEQPELESRGHEHCCKQCGRTFMSLKGLRSHERSHAALAAIKKLNYLPTSALKHK